jgi:hypothetical protein
MLILPIRSLGRKLARVEFFSTPRSIMQQNEKIIRNPGGTYFEGERPRGPEAEPSNPLQILSIWRDAQ